jgi:hypothetical protein
MTTTTKPTRQQTARVEELREELRAAGERFCAAAHDLEGPTHELAALEGQIRAAENAAGIFRPGGPPARSLAAEVVLGMLGSLWPCLPQLVTRESALRAEELLTAAPTAQTQEGGSDG